MDKIRSFVWRPTTTVILLGGFTLILIALVVAYISANFKPTTSVQLGSGYYQLVVADDDTERTLGLSGVESLEINGGLLMDFQAVGLWGIWMKDMKIPLDIIWLDEDKAVVHIEEEVSHELGMTEIFAPKIPSRYVIELPAGSVRKSGIKLNQTAQFNLSGATE